MMIRNDMLGYRSMVWAALSLTAVAFPAAAEIGLPAVFGNHMVLQQQTDAPIWGWGDPGERISISAGWLDRPVSCTVDDEGRWMTSLPTPRAGGPYSVTVAGSSSIAFTDVMIGEVWICSGQSNMEMPVDYVGPGYWGVIDYEKEIAAADYPNLRLFTVQRTVSTEPREDCTGQWRQCSPETVGSFSAVGYFFGRDLHEDLSVPIGMICTAWGGTPAQAWTDYEAMKTLPNWAGRLRDVDRFRADPNAFENEYRVAVTKWQEACRAVDAGLKGGWMRPDTDDSAWKTMDLPKAWENDKLGNFDGVVWFRTTVDVPDEWVDLKLVLELGPIDDWDVTWFNGLKIGAHDSGNVWQVDRSYTIPSGVVRAGSNSITVRVIDTGGGGGIYGRPEQLRLRRGDSKDSQVIALAGEWRFAVGAALSDLPPRPRQKRFNAGTPTSLYNGMIVPLVPYAIKGAIWYQGEANRSDPADYRTLFPTMIGCWRRAWDRGDFPFYFVQIAPFNYTLHGNQPSNLTAELREAQFMTLRVANTGMAVTMDIGNPRDIHPRDKRPIGERLARWAKAKTYGADDLVCSGPLYREMKIEGDRARLFFDHVGSGLVARDGELTHFTIAGTNGEFVPAEAVIDGDTVLVWSDKVKKPAAVRYAWSDAPDPNLFNAEGLPASSFRTDMPME
ncbi:MAG: hypothetical protein JSV91_03330 [Phycisphaerales bacterium]|nr:MAG: hypothetical protein JSV91_03330 [Phycisphaerales bacterium]